MCDTDTRDVSDALFGSECVVVHESWCVSAVFNTTEATTKTRLISYHRVFFIVVDSHHHFHSSGYFTRDEMWLRTFVSRDRNWIKNIGIKTHNKCDIICIRVRLLTAGLRGGGGVLFAGPSGSSTSRSFSRGFLGVCLSLSSTKLLMETNLWYNLTLQSLGAVVVRCVSLSCGIRAVSYTHLTLPTILLV